MTKRHFNDLFNGTQNEGKFLCVGLDTSYEKVPDNKKLNKSMHTGWMMFNASLIDMTANTARPTAPSSKTSFPHF